MQPTASSASANRFAVLAQCQSEAGPAPAEFPRSAPAGKPPAAAAPPRQGRQPPPARRPAPAPPGARLEDYLPPLAPPAGRTPARAAKAEGALRALDAARQAELRERVDALPLDEGSAAALRDRLAAADELTRALMSSQAALLADKAAVQRENNALRAAVRQLQERLSYLEAGADADECGAPSPAKDELRRQVSDLLVERDDLVRALREQGGGGEPRAAAAP